MENKDDQALSTLESSPAKLVGYVNPLGMIPSFLIPVFRKGGKLLLQESNSDETINSFYPYDESEFGEPGRVSLKLSAKPGDDTIYGFVFPSGALAVGPKREVAERLRKERRTLTAYPFLYMEVLDFLERYPDLDAQLQKLEQRYSRNSLMGLWTGLERNSVLEKKTPGDNSLVQPAETLPKAVSKIGINLPANFIRRVQDKPAWDRGTRAQRVGFVSSDKMTKTVVVRVDRLVLHSKYRRYVRRTGKFMAHDELGASVGDKVRIVETRPLSARKRWRVVEIIHKASH